MLIFSTNLFGQNDTLSLKGVTDSLVVVDVATIREATVKLTERIALKEICAQQDTIISNQKEIINEYVKYNLSIADENITLKKSLEEQERINSSLQKSFDRTKTFCWVLGGVSVSAIIVTVLNITLGGK